MYDWVAKETAEIKNKPNDYSSSQYDIKKAAEDVSKITLNIEKK